jgi:hypothetical protein
MTPGELEQTIRSLMQQPMTDAELRKQLEQLAAGEIAFSGFYLALRSGILPAQSNSFSNTRGVRAPASSPFGSPAF